MIEGANEFEFPNSYRVPKPNWDLIHNPIEETVTLKPYFEELNRQVWEIEESILTGAVVDLLRSKGYTVIEPTT